MKYYHLIGISGGLFALQFLLQNLLHLPLSLTVKWIFLIAQGILLVTYGGLTLFYSFILRKVSPKKSASKKVVPLKKEQKQSLRKAS
ncbi:MULTISPECIES: hypothetical protein [Enterococcus]|uniref:hypothetical protein n=1 Tax=Enterococcus TaxID=1350 RepID=UPI00065E5792|nr:MULTISPECIES: hypothetical protein [Enterococcus]KAF1302273.1 hypothetical protein BAU16_06975 [Enterococcus sp. JM9B]